MGSQWQKANCHSKPKTENKLKQQKTCEIERSGYKRREGRQSMHGGKNRGRGKIDWDSHVKLGMVRGEK